MWIRLLKSFTNNKGRKYPIGTKWNIVTADAMTFIKKGIAEPCEKNSAKLKTQLFNNS